jgi:glutamine synthetase
MNGDTALFPGNEDFEGLKVSSEFRWFLGGWMKHMPEMFSFYAPYPASFKRYVDGSFAPTKIVWARENRTAGFRIVGRGDSLRIECRLAGADANPYLAFASGIAAGLDGIENRIEPERSVQGNAYESLNSPSVPRTSEQSIKYMENSPWIRKAFGDEVIDHYLHFFRTEQNAFLNIVTDWERARYLERT